MSCKLCSGFGQGGLIAGSAVCFVTLPTPYSCAFLFSSFVLYVHLCVIKFQPKKQSGCGILRRKETRLAEGNQSLFIISAVHFMLLSRWEILLWA